jgi:hypothetical protein
MLMDNSRATKEDFMTLDRRSALAIGLAAASTAVVKPAASQGMDAGVKETSPWPGVVVRSHGETPAIIPGFKTVSLRDVVMQPGSKTAGPPMPNAMVCHITEGELRIEQDGKTFTGQEELCLDLQQGHQGAGLQ